MTRRFYIPVLLTALVICGTVASTASAGIPTGLTSAQMLDYVLKYPAATRSGAPSYWWQSGLTSDQLTGLAAAKTRLETYVNAYGGRSYSDQRNSLRILYPLGLMRGKSSEVVSWPVSLKTDIVSSGNPMNPGLAIATNVGLSGTPHYIHYFAFGLGAGNGPDPDGAGHLVSAQYRWRHYADICTAVSGGYGTVFNPADWCSNPNWIGAPSSHIPGWSLEWIDNAGSNQGETCSGDGGSSASITTLNSQYYVDGYDLKNRYKFLLSPLAPPVVATDDATGYPCPSPIAGHQVFTAAWLTDEQMSMQFGEYATEDNAAGGGITTPDTGFLASSTPIPSYDDVVNYGCGTDTYCLDFFKYVTLQTDTPPSGSPPPPPTACFVLPSPTDHNETATSYEADITALGWTGTATVHTYTDAQSDPTRGPSAVVTTDPSIGSCLPFGGSIGIWVNPSTLTTVPTGGSGGGGSGINFAPLQNLHTNCTSFPFGLFCYLSSALGWFNTAPVTPSFDITFDAPSFVYHNGSSNWIDPWHTDIGFSPVHYAGSLSAFDPYMAIVRTLESVALWVGGVWWIANKLWLNGDTDLLGAVDDGSPEL